MVTVSAGVDTFSPHICLILGACVGIITFFVGQQIFSTPLQDYCNITSVHLFCGLIGILLPPVFGDAHGFAFFGISSIRWIVTHLCWQTICTTMILGIFFLIFLCLFSVLYCLGLIHNDVHVIEHRRAKVFLKRGSGRLCTQRLFKLAHNPHLLLPGDKAKAQAYSTLSEYNWNYNRDQRSEVNSLPTYQTYRVEVSTEKQSLNSLSESGDHWRANDNTTSPLNIEPENVKHSVLKQRKNVEQNLARQSLRVQRKTPQFRFPWSRPDYSKHHLPALYSAQPGKLTSGNTYIYSI